VCNNNEKKSLLVIKKLKMMRRIKFLIASVLFCAMGYTGYTAYEKMTMSEAEKFMKANIEALTQDEGGGDTTYPGYFNKTKIIRNYSGCLSCEIESDAITPSVTIEINASGSLNYCKKGRAKDVCYKSMTGFTKF